MNFLDNHEKENINVQRIMLLIGLPFTVLLLMRIVVSGWETWMIPFILISTVAIIATHIFRGKETYSGIIISLVYLFYLFYYGCHYEVFAIKFPMALAFYMIVALLLYEKIIVLCGLIFYYVVFLYHFVNHRSLRFVEENALTAFIVIALWLFIRFIISRHNREVATYEEKFNAISFEQRKREDFLANISHELRTPVNAILGITGSAMELESDSAAARNFHAIDRAGRRLYMQMEDILYYYEIIADRLDVEEGEYSFETLLKEIKTFAENENSEKQLNITYEVADDIPARLYGDVRKILHCMEQVISNAINHSAAGNIRIIIKARKEVYGINLNLLVEDEGSGISAELIEKTYGRYFDPEEGDTLRSKGLKLGLIIARNLVNAMDGLLNIDSTVGQGTTVSITIPQEVRDSRKWIEERADHKTREDLLLFGKHVLVVDDDSMNIMVLEKLLKAYGASCRSCDNGREAVQICENESFHLILMDYMMPEMDGLETLKHIRNGYGVNTYTPVIAVTANTISGIRQQLIGEGFDDYVAKPVSRAQLEEAIANTIYRAKCTEKKPKSPCDALMEAGVNVKAALEYCGDSQDLYMMLLKDFAAQIPDKELELSSFLSLKDEENYRIKVHALKSNLRTLGFDSLSKEALSLENACKENRFEEVSSGHRILMDRLKDTKDTIDRIIDK